MDKDVYVGIDVSKTELVVAVRPSSESFTLAYHRAGLKQLVGRLGELKPKLVVVEATGGLQRQVVAALWTGGIAVAAVNPSWVRSGLHPNFPPVISRVRRLFRPSWGVSFVVVVSCSSQFFRPPFTL